MKIEKIKISSDCQAQKHEDCGYIECDCWCHKQL